jgi:hypothetical protein
MFRKTNHPWFTWPRLTYPPPRFNMLRKRTNSYVESSWNVMAHGDARAGMWRGNWRMEWVAITLHTTSEHGISSITTADAHTSAASSRLNWRPYDLNGLVRFAETRNLISARVPSHFKRCLRCFNVCDLLNPMIRRTGLTRLLKFGSKAP